MPYGDRPSEEVVALTRAGVEWLFARGCRLVVLACNTATVVACRSLQRDWLPGSRWEGHNVLGIVAPTVEAIFLALAFFFSASESPSFIPGSACPPFTSASRSRFTANLL